VAYEVEMLPRATRQLSRLPDAWQAKLEERLRALAEEPRPPEAEPMFDTADIYWLQVDRMWISYRVHDDLSLVRVRRVREQPL
jgi:mRNA-degrading endonuclease RelE of RelBE toxin-antitoxin system